MFTPLAALAVAAVLLLAPASPAERTLPASTFAFGIGNGMLDGEATAVAERLGGFDLVVVDGEEATAEDVAALKASGATVLAYLSVGTIESYRGWYGRIKRYRLEAWEDWKDEWFADVSRAGLRRAFTGRIAPAILAKGFDGLFLDNVDMIETRNHREQRTGMRKLVFALERLVAADGRLLFAQNGHWGFEKLGLFAALDGWNREDVTWGYDFDRKRYVRNPDRVRDAALDEIRDVAGRGLTVTATDYTAAGDAAAQAEAVANSCAAGALPYVSDIGLSVARLPNPPLTC